MIKYSEQKKYEMLKKELKGLDVTWLNHQVSGSKAINMAKVNGHSIIWHSWGYTSEDEPTVEVMFTWDDDVQEHVPIKGLREKIEDTSTYAENREAQVRAEVRKILDSAELDYDKRLEETEIENIKELEDELTNLVLENK